MTEANEVPIGHGAGAGAAPAIGRVHQAGVALRQSIGGLSAACQAALQTGHLDSALGADLGERMVALVMDAGALLAASNGAIEALLGCLDAAEVLLNRQADRAVLAKKRRE